MDFINCNLCGADDSLLWGEKNEIKIVECKRCGLIYCNPRPDNSELQKFYDENYFVEGNYEADEQRRQMYEIEIGEIKNNIGAEGKFLDVGCAVGTFLSLLPDTFEKWGTEFSSAAAKIGREKFKLNILEGELRHIRLPEKYFDIIQTRGVLEHSQNPFEDLIKINRILRDDGILRISQLPNIKSLCARLYRTRFNQVKPGEHLYYFSRKTIKDMLNKAGFRIVRLRFPYLNTPYSSLLKDTARMLTFFFTKDESPAFFGNMMIVYARKRAGT